VALGTSSIPTHSTRSLAAELALPALVALGAGLAVGLPYELAGGRHALVLGGAAALPVAIVAAWMLAARWDRRLARLARFAEQLEGGTSVPFLAAERTDLLGDVESALGRMARGVVGTISALNVERERLEAILRGMVEGVVVIDLVGTVVLMNARAREVLGLPVDGVWRGRPLVELVRDPGLADVVRQVAAGAPVTSRDVTLEASGGLMLQVNAARLRGVDERPFGFVLVLHDVTELRRLEVVRRDFVANVSHELRTPLTAIKGYAETLLGPAGDERETARRFLGVIDRHSERLGRLIDDLLTLSDLELGRTALRLGTVAVGSVIDDVLQILGEPARRKGLRLAADVASDVPPAHADGDRLRQVLINLVDNGIKYTPSGGRVLVRARRGTGAHANLVEIAVEDTGVGIPTQDLPRLTERFFRVDKARSRELGGTGLGLAIVKHIVQGHGGALHIASALGEGTTVTAHLPVAATVRQAS
jgi:two-component system phosphate regulon sensor histidine kinase PhoR